MLICIRRFKLECSGFPHSCYTLLLSIEDAVADTVCSHGQRGTCVDRLVGDVYQISVFGQGESKPGQYVACNVGPYNYLHDFGGSLFQLQYIIPQNPILIMKAPAFVMSYCRFWVRPESTFIMMEFGRWWAKSGLVANFLRISQDTSRGNLTVYAPQTLTLNPEP